MIERIDLLDGFSVVDATTGTIVGTENLFVVPGHLVDDEHLENASAAADLAHEHGIPMYVSLDDLPDIPE